MRPQTLPLILECCFSHQTLIAEKQHTMDQIVDQKLLLEAGAAQLNDMVSQLAREQDEAERHIATLEGENRTLMASISEMEAEGECWSDLGVT